MSQRGRSPQHALPPVAAHGGMLRADRSSPTGRGSPRPRSTSARAPRGALHPGQAERAEVGIWPRSFVSTACAAARSASLAAASTMSASISGSSGSIARGSMAICTSSPAPFALTVTIPPPAEASPNSFLASSCARAICSCICWACFISAFMSSFTSSPPLRLRRGRSRGARSGSAPRSARRPSRRPHRRRRPRPWSRPRAFGP